MADLAILHLTKTPYVKPAAIAAMGSAGKLVLASFGFFVFTDDNNIRQRGFKPGVQYMDGVEQLSGKNFVVTNPQGCGRSQTPDAFCTEPYAGGIFSVPEPSEQNTTICEGDSGGPVYQSTLNGFAVVGLITWRCNHWP